MKYDNMSMYQSCPIDVDWMDIIHAFKEYHPNDWEPTREDVITVFEEVAHNLRKDERLSDIKHEYIQHYVKEHNWEDTRK